MLLGVPFLREICKITHPITCPGLPHSSWRSGPSTPLPFGPHSTLDEIIEFARLQPFILSHIHLRSSTRTTSPSFLRALLSNSLVYWTIDLWPSFGFCFLTTLKLDSGALDFSWTRSVVLCSTEAYPGIRHTQKSAAFPLNLTRKVCILPRTVEPAFPHLPRAQADGLDHV